MSKLLVAICDTNQAYRERFAAYVIEHRAREMTIHVFSAPEIFLEAVQTESFDLVIFGNGFEEVGSLLQGSGIPQIFLRETEQECEGSVQEDGVQDRCVNVFRYQPMENILREMRILTGRAPGEGSVSTAFPSRLEIIGVYSPVGHEMQMPFSMVLAEALAEKKKTLYVNLMAYAGFLGLYGLSGVYDLGDVVHRLRNNRLFAEDFLRSVYEVGRVSYIPPFANPENLHDFTGEDYLALLEYLSAQTDFEAVVFDFGEGIGGFLGMLLHCTSIYCPVKRGFFYECRVNHFLEHVDREEAEGIRGRIQMVNLPFSARQIRGGSDVLRQLSWSEFGDYVRGYLTGGVT